MRAFDELDGASSNGSLLNQWQGPWNAIYRPITYSPIIEKVNTTQLARQQSAGQAYF